MRKKLIIICLVLVVLVGGIAYLTQQQVKVGTQVIKTDTEKEVLTFLKNENYKVIEFNDKGYYEYVLTEEASSKQPTQSIWSFNKNPKDYIGKKIEEHYAVVTNHPLESKYPNKRIRLTVLKTGESIIGGIATVESEDSTIFNLDGSPLN